MTVIITGASAGIGRELALQLDAAGAKLVLVARRREKLDELNQRLGGRHVCVTADVSRQEDCQRLIDESFAAVGRIDTLVLNAGFGLYETVADTTPEQTRGLFATNLFGTTDCIHAAVSRLKAQALKFDWRGQIMIVSSAVARRGIPVLGVYSATKAAQLSIAEALRVELAGDRIAVTSVHPVMTKTDFGTTAETFGSIRLPKSDRDKWTQTVEYVVAKMVKAIQKPRPEVWPGKAARWAFGLGTLMPGLLDKGMKRYLAGIREATRDER